MAHARPEGLNIRRLRRLHRLPLEVGFRSRAWRARVVPIPTERRPRGSWAAGRGRPPDGHR